MDWLTTSTVLDGLRQPDNETAWQHFVQRFREPIHQFVRRFDIVEGDVEDVAQETLAAFAQALRAGHYQRERGKLSSWLFGIAHKQALRQRDRRRRRDETVLSGSELDRAAFALSDEKSAHDLWNTLWDRFLVAECLRRVRQEFSAEHLQAFELLVYEDRSPQEAAAGVGLTVRAVYNAKHRILKRMRELHAELEGDV
jgi:RNA polymerase sigma-70 factor (ECF subfamily)